MLIFCFPAGGQEQKPFQDAMKKAGQHNQGVINYDALIG